MDDTHEQSMHRRSPALPPAHRFFSASADARAATPAAGCQPALIEMHTVQCCMSKTVTVVSGTYCRRASAVLTSHPRAVQDGHGVCADPAACSMCISQRLALRAEQVPLPVLVLQEQVLVPARGSSLPALRQCCQSRAATTEMLLPVPATQCWATSVLIFHLLAVLPRQVSQRWCLSSSCCTQHPHAPATFWRCWWSRSATVSAMRRWASRYRVSLSSGKRSASWLSQRSARAPWCQHQLRPHSGMQPLVRTGDCQLVRPAAPCARAPG